MPEGRKERRAKSLARYRAEKRIRKSEAKIRANPEMTRENVLLAEFQEAKDSGQIREMIRNPEDPEDLRFYSMVGMKVYAVYDSQSSRIAQYDAVEDRTDLECLRDKGGHFLCCVSKDEYGNFKWKCFRIGGWLDDKGIVALKDGRDCTEEECGLLDEIYPEYLSHAF